MKSTRMIFKEKYELCLEEIKKQDLKVNNAPSIWKSSNDFEGCGFKEFVKKSDDVLSKVRSICSNFGLDLYFEINVVLNEDWTVGSLKDSKNTMYDYNSDLLIEEFRSFMDSVYYTIKIPIVLLIFCCVRSFYTEDGLDINMKLNAINISVG